MTGPPTRARVAEQLEQVRAELSRRDLSLADRDRLLAEQRELRTMLNAARRHAATQPSSRRR